MDSVNNKQWMLRLIMLLILNVGIISNGKKLASFNHKKNSTNSFSAKNSNLKLSALVDKSITLTCSIDLDNKNFTKSGNYKIIWSRESDNGKDYEPLALDDNRLISNQRIVPNRIQTNEKIIWNLVINNLKITDSNNYICQLNRKPYDVFWLKRFMLNVYEPASFADYNISYNSSTSILKYENSMYVKNVNENQDFKLECQAKGRPKPTITWFLKYTNGSSFKLEIDNNELIIKNIKRTSKLDRVECQITNGYGPSAIRSFKININHSPHIISKPKTYRVPIRTSEIKLNCSSISNPSSSFKWFHIRSNNENTNSTESEYSIDTGVELKNGWKLLNPMASYTYINKNYNPNNLKFSKNLFSSDQPSNTVAKIPLSKYQISEKQVNDMQINSILTIRMINEKDYGIYKCVAINNLGNKTVEYKLEKLFYESLKNDRFKSLYGKDEDSSQDQHTYSLEKELNWSKKLKSKSNKSITNSSKTTATKNPNDYDMLDYIFDENGSVNIKSIEINKLKYIFLNILLIVLFEFYYF